MYRNKNVALNSYYLSELVYDAGQNTNKKC